MIESSAALSEMTEVGSVIHSLSDGFLDSVGARVFFTAFTSSPDRRVRRRELETLCPLDTVEAEGLGLSKKTGSTSPTVK